MYTVNSQRVPFTEAVSDCTGGNLKIKRRDYKLEGQLPVIDQGQDFVAGYIDEVGAAYRGKLPIILFGDHTRCFKIVNFPFALGADGVKALEPKEGFDAKFLYFYFRSVRLPNAGYSRHFKFLREISVPKPSLDEQHYIVDILSRAEGIVRLRREAKKKTEEIIPALFFEMFGDPATNPKGWPKKPFADVVENMDGKRKPIKASYRSKRKGPYPYYGASGIIDYFDDYLFDGTNLLIAEDGANLLSRSTPIAFLASGKYWVNNHAHVVASNGKANLTFLECLLNQRDLKDSITGSAQPKLNQANLNSILVLDPPIAMQNIFEERVEQMRSIQSQQAAALEKALSMLDALLADAFNRSQTN